MLGVVSCYCLKFSCSRPGDQAQYRTVTVILLSAELTIKQSGWLNPRVVMMISDYKIIIIQ